MYASNDYFDESPPGTPRVRPFFVNSTAGGPAGRLPRPPPQWNSAHAICRKLEGFIKPILFLVLSAITASYLSITYYGSWNRAALQTVHYEIVLLSDQVRKNLETMENGNKQLVVLLKGIHDLISAGALSELAAKQVRDKIKKEIALYDSDKTGMTDYALSTLGGCIRSTKDTVTYKDGGTPVLLLGFPIMSFAQDPKAIITASVLPGECWAFKGQTGRAVIELITKVMVTHVTLEHIPATISPDGEISSAPKKFSLWGLSSLHDSNPVYFGCFTYSKSGPAVQTFPVVNTVQKAFKLVEFVVESNHGNPTFTCVYRVRIHGKLPGVHLD